MPKVVGKRTKYLQEFYQDINDEIQIAIANTSDLRSAYGYATFKFDYVDKLDFDSLVEKTSHLFENRDIRLFSAIDEPQQDQEDFAYFLEGIRLRTLIEVSADFLVNINQIKYNETYKKMKMLFSKDKDITLLALDVEAIKLYAQDDLATIKRNEEYLPTEFVPLMNKIKKLTKEISEEKSRLKVIDLAYQTEYLIADYFEDLNEKNFEWTNDEIKRGNWFVSLLAEIEAHYYFLLLIREEQIVKLDLIDNPNIDSRTDLYHDKLEMLNEAKTMQEVGVSYTDEDLKNHKK